MDLPRFLRPPHLSGIPSLILPNTMKRSRIALFGIFGVQNIGNECTLQAMLHNVRERLPNAEVYSICYVPQDTIRRHALKAVPVSCAFSRTHESGRPAPQRTKVARLLRGLLRRLPAELSDWFRAVKALRGTDLLVMTGTGMLTDYSTSSLGYPYDVFKWTLAARMAGSKVRFVGIGVGPIYERLSRAFIKSALAMAGYRSFRDHSSKSRLKQLGFDTTNDPVFPDLAFSLPRGLFLPRVGNGRRKRVVGLGVMHHVDVHVASTSSREEGYQSYLDKMCDFTAWLIEHGYCVRILQGDIKYDRPVRGDFRERMEQRNYPYAAHGIVDEDVTSVEDLLTQLADVDVVVSPRLHNLILGLMLNKPVISISYDPKTDALLEGIGLGEYRQPIDNVNVATLVDQFIDLEAKSQTIHHLVSQRVEEYRSLLERQYTIVLGDI